MVIKTLHKVFNLEDGTGLSAARKAFESFMAQKGIFIPDVKKVEKWLLFLLEGKMDINYCIDNCAEGQYISVIPLVLDPLGVIFVSHSPIILRFYTVH